MTIRKGTRVSWEWGNGTAEGKVESTHTDEVSRTIKGSKTTRKGSSDDPALVIKQDDGTTVLKLRSEVKRADG
jgi:hypothetical protein